MNISVHLWPQTTTERAAVRVLVESGYGTTSLTPDEASRLGVRLIEAAKQARLGIDGRVSDG